MSYESMAFVRYSEYIPVASYNRIIDNMDDHESRIRTQEDIGAANLDVGSIVLYHGLISALPETWAVCDGTNGTPDLRDRFVIGAGNNYAVGNVGGVAEHDHTIPNTGAGRGHDHSFSGSITSFGTQTRWLLYDVQTVSSWDHYHSISGTTGGSSDHSHGVPDANINSNLPPFKALYYIMRVG